MYVGPRWHRLVFLACWAAGIYWGPRAGWAQENLEPTPAPAAQSKPVLPCPGQCGRDQFSPLVEQQPGQNLYWHDPATGWFSDCRDWSPADLGYAPRWFARADVLSLFRNPKAHLDAQALGPDGPIVLSNSDLDAEFDAGVRVSVGRALGEWYRLEAVYFGSFDWSDQCTIRDATANSQGGTGNLYSPFSDFGVPTGVVGQDFNNLAALSFQSRLNNVELNLRRRLWMKPGAYEASFLVGARFMRIEDTLGYFTQSATPGPAVTSNDLTVAASNDMIGVQIGLLGQFLVQPRSWIDFEAKGGIFQNNAGQTSTLVVVDAAGASTSTTFSNDRDRTTFVGDLSLQYNYEFARSWTFYAGYNAVFVSGVALGANNFQTDVNILALGPARVNHDANIFYHGPNIGVVFAR